MRLQTWIKSQTRHRPQDSSTNRTVVETGHARDLSGDSLNRDPEAKWDIGHGPNAVDDER